MADAPLTITITSDQDATVVRITGWAGLGAQASLEREVTRLSAMTHRVLVLEMSELLGMSSLAVGQLVQLHRAVSRRGGRMAIAQPSDEVRTLLVRCRIDAVVPMHDSVHEALGAPTRPS